MNDPQARQRWIISISLAIAINEIVIGLFHLSDEKVEQKVEPTIVTLERATPRPTPKPTPRPTVPPTPPPVVHVPPHATPAPKPQVAAAKMAGPKARTHGGAPARHATHKTDVYAQLAKSGLGRAHGIAGSGQGTGVGAGSGGGEGGSGTGTGSGNGTGTVNANTPCGVVTFNIKGAPKYLDRTTATENVNATVQFPDGHTETAFFPYKWVYHDAENTDPWSSTNLKNHPGDDFEIVAQLPPPGTDSSDFPPLIKYILAHTGPDGRTSLPPCPNAGPPPPPR